MTQRLSLVGVLLLSLLFGCSPRPLSRDQETVMGVSSEIMIVGKQRAEAQRILKETFEILRSIEEKWNPDKATSEIYRINQKGFDESQEISQETFELIQKSFEFFEKSEGAFDITTRPLRKLWGFVNGEPHLPTPEQIQALLPRVGANQISLDARRWKVRFQIPEMEIDLNGMARGYACDQAIKFLSSQGVENALVNIGGTIAVRGNGPNGKPWRVGLLHPRDPTRTLKVLTLVNEAVSTRRDDERFFVLNSHRYSDIINPRTGYPASQTVVVSVVAPSALMAEALATSLFVLGPEKAHSFANQFPVVKWYLTYFTEGERFKTLSSESA